MVNRNILSTDPMLARFVGRLVDGFHPKSLYLFGSRARGEANADSDYDIVMIVDALSQPAYRVSQDAHSSLWDIGAATDIFVRSRAITNPRPGSAGIHEYRWSPCVSNGVAARER